MGVTIFYDELGRYKGPAWDRELREARSFCIGLSPDCLPTGPVPATGLKLILSTEKRARSAQHPERNTPKMHDKHGNKINTGDKVTLLCTVAAITGGPGPDCNIQIVSVGAHPNGYRPSIACNAALVALAPADLHPNDIKGRAVQIRALLVSLERDVRAMADHIVGLDGDELPIPANPYEMTAQAKIAVRDLEAAGMRLGKVVQYMEGGVSILRPNEVFYRLSGKLDATAPDSLAPIPMTDSPHGEPPFEPAAGPEGE